MAAEEYITDSSRTEKEAQTKQQIRITAKQLVNKPCDKPGKEGVPPVSNIYNHCKY